MRNVLLLVLLLASGCAGPLAWRPTSSAGQLSTALRHEGSDTSVVLETSFYNWELKVPDQVLFAEWLDEDGVTAPVLSRDERYYELGTADRVVIDYCLMNREALAKAELAESVEVYDSARGRMIANWIVTSDGVSYGITVCLGDQFIKHSFGEHLIEDTHQAPFGTLNGLNPIVTLLLLLGSRIDLDTSEPSEPEHFPERLGERGLADLLDSLQRSGIDTVLSYSMRWYVWSARAWKTQGYAVWPDSPSVLRAWTFADGSRERKRYGDRLPIDLFLANDSLLADSRFIVDPALFDTSLGADHVLPVRTSDFGDATLTLRICDRTITKHRPSWCIRENGVSRAYLRNISSPLHTWMMWVERSAL